MASMDSTSAEQAMTEQKTPKTPKVFVAWLNENVNEEHPDFKWVIDELDEIVDAIVPLPNMDMCLRLVDGAYRENIIIISSPDLAQQIVPRVRDKTQVNSIYLFGDNLSEYKSWANRWPKIKGVYQSILPICKAVQLIMKKATESALPFSIIETGLEGSNINLDRLDPSFIYMKLLKEALLTTDHQGYERDLLMKYFEQIRDETAKPPNDIDAFIRDYSESKAIYWYTRASFIYETLNEALRLFRTEVLLSMGLIIHDLQRQIEKLHKEQFTENNREPFTVYRGQALPKKDLLKLQKTEGGLITFHNFLSTSLSRDISDVFAQSCEINPDLVPVVFIMRIDPKRSSSTFADVHQVTHFEGEREILFSMLTVFRIGATRPIRGHGTFFEVELTLVAEEDPQLSELYDYLQQETDANSKNERIANILMNLGQAAAAEKFFLTTTRDDIIDRDHRYYLFRATIKLHKGDYHAAKEYLRQTLSLEQSTNTRNSLYFAHIYKGFGHAEHGLGEQTAALSYFETALGIFEKVLSPNHPHIACSYSSIASVYESMGDYPKALSYYETALGMRQKVLSPNHPHLASSYNNIASVYESMGDYPKALSYFETALAMRQKVLSPNHPNLASSYNNIASVYESMGDYPKALAYFETALAMREKVLSPNHPHITSSYNNIAVVYKSMGDYPKALSYYETALGMRQKVLSPNHPHLASSYSNIASVYESMGDYPKALAYFERALGMRQKVLSPNHPDIASSCNNIAAVYESMGNYPKALSYYETAVGIFEKVLSPNHPHLASSYNNIAVVYKSMGDYPKALAYFERALGMRQKVLPSNHPHITSSYNNIAGVYESMRDYPKALAYFERALGMRQKVLSPNHPHIASSYNNIAVVYKSMGDYPKALAYFETAVGIFEKVLSLNHPHIASSCNNIAVVYKSMGDYPKALSYYETALGIFEKVLSPNHPDIASSYNNIASVYKSMGDYPKALSYYGTALAMREKVLSPNHPDIGSSHFNMGLVHMTNRTELLAVRHLEEAQRIWSVSIPADHPRMNRLLKILKTVEK